MAEQIAYRTDLGVVAAAGAQHAHGLADNLKGSVENAKIQLLRTAGGLDLLVASVSGSVHRPTAGVETIAAIQQGIFDSIRASSDRNIPAVMKDALQQANNALFNSPAWRGGGLTTVLAVISGKRLYLSQVGNCRAYLVRDRHALLLTQDQTIGSSQPDGITLSGASVDPPRYLGKDPNLAVDTQFHADEFARQNYMDLGPGDGVILCTDGVVDRVLRQDALLGENFFQYFESQPSDSIADRLISISARKYPSENHAAVVLKADDEAPPVTFAGAGSCLSQVGVIAAILILSIAFGLGAAFGIPALMNPKTSASIPNTGANLAQPGFISVAEADGDALVTLPGQSAQNLVTGAMIEARPGSQITTTKGKTKLQLADGTIVYVNESSSLTLKEIADPRLNQPNTFLVLNGGGIMLDTTRTSDAVSVILTIPGTARGSAIGQFIGATFLPDQKRLDVDCLEGSCQIAGATASRDLMTGQRSSVTNGVVGSLESARWDQWANLCDSDCPFQSQAVSPTSAPVMTPTFVPTSSVPIPYLGAMTGNSNSNH
jgi:serine/threonine protein phosphatase PrpC